MLRRMDDQNYDEEEVKEEKREEPVDHNNIRDQMPQRKKTAEEVFPESDVVINWGEESVKGADSFRGPPGFWNENDDEKTAENQSYGRKHRSSRESPVPSRSFTQYPAPPTFAEQYPAPPTFAKQRP
eukprot:740746_1